MNLEIMPEPDTQDDCVERIETKFAIAAYPEAYVSVDDMKFGRRSAGSGFLEAVCRYVDHESYALAVSSESDLHQLHLEMVQYKNSAPTLNTIALGDQAALSRSGALFLPGPVLSDQTWARRMLADDAYSIVGLTHTVATLQAALPLSRYFTDPTQPWDALICSSEAVKRVIHNIFGNYREYLKSRGINAPTPPIELPVIPLGIHCDHFDATSARKVAAKAFRQARGISEDDIVLLSFGRIDPATKAHPIPLFLSVENAQRSLAGRAKLHLVMVGTFLPAKMAQVEVTSAAKKYAPSVMVHWVDGKDKHLSETSWHAADIFLSLPDNTQESFGLTPVEAMGASLPCIVSDWNGYKETVLDGETGIRVPTALPEASLGIGSQLSDRYTSNLDSESIYLYGIAQVTMVDIRKCAEAIASLALDRDRRLKMGHRGRMRVEQNYAWKKIIGKYAELFSELETIREATSTASSRRDRTEAARPELGDPLKVFSDYPSKLVSTSSHVVLSRNDAAQHLDSILKQMMCNISQQIAGTPDDMKHIVSLLSSGSSVSISQLCAQFPQLSPSQVLASCMWLAKYDIISIS